MKCKHIAKQYTLTDYPVNMIVPWQSDGQFGKVGKIFTDSTFPDQ